MRRRTLLQSGALLVAAGLPAMSAGAPPEAVEAAYRQEIEQFRQRREARLRGESGWLSLAGLYWLTQGTHRFGSDPKAEIPLPQGAPAQAGTLTLAAGKVSAQLADGVGASIAGNPVSGAVELRPDDPGPPDVLAIGAVSLQVIRRADKLGIRIKDANSQARRMFAGLRWFPVRSAWKISARFVPHDGPRFITVPSAVGPAQTLPSSGAAVFTVGGRELRLDAILEEPTADELFFIFRDQTSAKETYGAGRFLYTPLPQGGKVTLDFNKAFSPPCAFTPFATCPLPPPQNRLPIRVDAGELAPATPPKPTPTQ